MSKKKKFSEVSDEVVMNKIYMIRGHKVMLDRDLALLYEIKSIRLREQVKRNKLRFPRNFMFQLTEKETEIMVSQNAIPSKMHLGGSLPMAFTEHGVLMLANVLKNDKAVKVSIRIIEVFVKILEMIMTSKDVLLKLNHLERNVSNSKKDIQIIFETLRELLQEPDEPKKRVGYKHCD